MFCPHCGKQFTPDANFCPNCGAVTTQQPFTAPPARGRIVRPRNPRLIAGVCSGFALHYGWDVALTRVVFALLTLLTAFWLGVILYIVAWVILPDAQYTLPPGVQPNGPNASM
jgi:phage shock protein C